MTTTVVTTLRDQDTMEDDKELKGDELARKALPFLVESTKKLETVNDFGLSMHFAKGVVGGIILAFQDSELCKEVKGLQNISAASSIMGGFEEFLDMLNEVRLTLKGREEKEEPPTKKPKTDDTQSDDTQGDNTQ